MTITELMLNFRSALCCLAHCAERVHVPWRRPDAYDEWDTVATAAFAALVTVPVRAALTGGKYKTLDLAPYDMLVPDYRGCLAIEVLPAKDGYGLHIFHAFGTGLAPFDVVEMRLVDETGAPHSDSLHICKVESARFRLRVWQPDSTSHVLDQLEA